MELIWRDCCASRQLHIRPMWCGEIVAISQQNDFIKVHKQIILSQCVLGKNCL